MKVAAGRLFMAFGKLENDYPPEETFITFLT